MALRKTQRIPHGPEVAGLYHRVEVMVVKNKTKLHYSVYSYLDDKEAEPLVSRSYMLDYNEAGGSVYAQAYADLKTRAGFVGAEDC